MIRLQSRRLLWLFGSILGLLALAWFSHFLSEQYLRQLALRLLGPGSEVAAVNLHLDRIELQGVRIPTVNAWPAADAARADRVDIVPEWGSLLGPQIHIRSLAIHGAYFLVLRTEDRQVRFLPTLLPRPKRPPGQPPRRIVQIDQANVESGTLDLFDASIRQPAHQLRLIDVRGQARNMRFPKLDTRTEFELKGQGIDRPDPGEVIISGWTQFSRRDSSVAVTLRKLPLVRLEPYVLRRLEAGVEGGRFDLQMQFDVRDRQIVAPGHMRFTDLKLAPAEGVVATFMGLPRRAVIKALADRKDRIDLDFEMRGPLGDTRFSLNESFALRTTVGLGAALGLSLGGVVEGIGSLGGRGLNAVGHFVGDLFGADDKKDKAAKSPADSAAKPAKEQKPTTPE